MLNDEVNAKNEITVKGKRFFTDVKSLVDDTTKDFDGHHNLADNVQWGASYAKN